MHSGVWHLDLAVEEQSFLFFLCPSPERKELWEEAEEVSLQARPLRMTALQRAVLSWGVVRASERGEAARAETC